MTKRPEPSPLQTIDLSRMGSVHGGAINWRYQAYRIGAKIASWDPSRVAAGFLM